MDYVGCYNRFISYCKNTSPRERLDKRNAVDIRLTGGRIYVEIHHIIPRYEHGSNLPDNLVELLPEEHLFIHQLRYKCFSTRGDMLAVRFILNGLMGIKNTNINKALNSFILNKKILGVYSWMKQNSSEFRIIHGWHTQEGRDNISKSLKGKLIVKDKDTGEIIGRVDKNHINIISGQWVHHTRGYLSVTEKSTNTKIRIKSEEYQNNKHLYKRVTIGGAQAKENNGNFSGYNDEDILSAWCKAAEKLGYVSYVRIRNYLVDNNIPTLYNINSRFGGMKCFTKIISETTGLQIKNCRGDKSDEHKAKLSKATSNYCWITDVFNKKHLKIKKEWLYMYNTNQFIRGRKKCL